MKNNKFLSIIGLLGVCALAVFSPGFALANDLSASQTNISLNAGQNTTVTFYPSNNQTLNIVYISDTNSVSAGLQGNTLNLYGIQSGSSQIRVCTYDSSCSTIYVTVAGNNNYYGTFSLSQSNFSMNLYQSATVSITGNNYYSFYISSNSNSNVVSTNISGSTINLYANQSGSSTISVCANNYSTCQSLYVTVSGGNYYGDFSLSQSNLSMTVNQNSSVSITGNSYNTFYISSNSNSDIVSAYISNATVNLYAKQNGSSTISVCANSYSTCRSLYVTVSGNYGGGSISVSPTSVSLTMNQNTTVYVYGGYSPYYISRNSNSSVVTASISGSTINLYGQNNGSASITVCGSNYSNCIEFPVTVTGYNNSSLYFITTALPQPVVGYYYSNQIQISGGTAPYYFSLISGALPSGLTLSSNGLVSGYVSSGLVGSFTIQVTDTYGRSANQYYTLNSGNNGGRVLGTNIYNNGTLIKDNSTIYLTYKNTKIGFASMDAFNGLGFKLSNVISGSASSLINSSYIIGTSSTAHPWGSWIKAGNTIYFVHEDGLIPISTYESFLNNGGQDKLVVPFNGYDFGKNILSIMTNNDERLRP